ncbi:MAG: hypothetical protein LBL64_08665 [Treponema sp.]|jgi:capsule polysaccharide export protein KpsE/RkpR|nr:hypothetical protein [Treponema sp.]
MTFGERMKQFFDQGASASKEFMAMAGEKVQNWGEKSYQASQDLLVKAGEKAQDLGERGVLLLEIKQLEDQAQKLLGTLGTDIYTAYAEQGRRSFSVDTPDLKNLLAEIDFFKKEIEKREKDLKSRSTPVLKD